MSCKRVIGSTILGAVLSASLLLGAAIPASADQDDHCRHDVQRAERNLDKAVRKYGEQSRQAEDRRHQLEEVRERCHMRGDDHDRH